MTHKQVLRITLIISPVFLLLSLTGFFLMAPGSHIDTVNNQLQGYIEENQEKLKNIEAEIEDLEKEIARENNEAREELEHSKYLLEQIASDIRQDIESLQADIEEQFKENSHRQRQQLIIGISATIIITLLLGSFLYLILWLLLIRKPRLQRYILLIFSILFLILALLQIERESYAPVVLAILSGSFMISYVIQISAEKKGN